MKSLESTEINILSVSHDRIDSSITTLPSIRRLLPKNCKYIKEDFLAYGDLINVSTHNLNVNLNKFLRKGSMKSSTIKMIKRLPIFQSPTLRSHKKISQNPSHRTLKAKLIQKSLRNKFCVLQKRAKENNNFVELKVIFIFYLKF